MDDINEASRVARDLGYHNKVVTLDGQVVNAGGSFTGGSVQRSAGLFTRKQELEELRVKAAKLQKDCLAAQEKTDQCKAQMDAVSAELTAANSEQITAANDRVRAEAEQKRLEVGGTPAHRRGRRCLPDPPAGAGRPAQRQAAGTDHPPEGRRAGSGADRRAGTAHQRRCCPQSIAGREPDCAGRSQCGLPGGDRSHPEGQERERRADRCEGSRDPPGHRGAPDPPEG